MSSDPVLIPGDVHTMLGKCWASVGDAGPTLTQHCVNVSCLMGGPLYLLKEVSNQNKIVKYIFVVDHRCSVNQII